MAKTTSFAGKSQAELADREQKTRKDLFDLNFQHATRKLANTSELADKRKELARILTAMNQPTA